ncbi:TPA: pentapeptide repeat-containing protein [Legionella bozemanae]
MKKIILTASLIGGFYSSFQSYAYIPNDVTRFEKEVDCIKCNLTGNTLSHDGAIKEKTGRFDGALFTKVFLSGYKIMNSSFIDNNFVKSILINNEFNSSIFQNVNLSYSDLLRVKFTKSTFKDVNFAHVSMDGFLSSCSFNNVDFTNANLQRVSFSKAQMIDVNFSDADLNHADFSKANVEDVNFKNADLSYAILIGSNITKDHLSKTKIYKCATLSNGEVYTNNGEFSCN